MPNMSYCRFRNTLLDLRNCYHNLDNIESIEELKAAKELLKLCKELAEYEIDELIVSNEE